MDDLTTAQASLQDRAKQVLPAGGFGNFDPSIFIARGEGGFVYDSDGHRYVDYLIGSGPMLLGHGHPEVIDAVQEQLAHGMTFFANNEQGLALAEEIVRAVPCAQQLRYVSAGGEADMYAMRLARAYRGKSKILKFEGGYHGMCAEAQMSLAPDRQVNFPQAVPDSAGIPASVEADMLIAPFNDVSFVESLVAEFEDELAAIIVEPLQRIIPPAPGFLEALREICDRTEILLIFDEVVTGFRFAYEGAQGHYGVTPDLATFGKVIGGGFPLAAIVGPHEIMKHFDKSAVGQEGFLMQLGTLSGNPVASVAGLKTLEILRRPGSYECLYDLGNQLMNMVADALNHEGIAHRIVGHPTLFDVLFCDHDIADYRDVKKADAHKNALFNKVLRQEGIFKSAGKIYPHLGLQDEHLEITERALREAAKQVARQS